MRRSARARILTLGSIAVACALAAAVVWLVFGGGGSHPSPRRQAAAPSATTGPAPATAPAKRCSGGWTRVATTKGAIRRYAHPGGTEDGTIPARWYGGVSTLPVVGQHGGWLEVRLVTRPNGSTTWVRRADVTLRATPYRIDVDVATRHLALYRLCRRLMNAPAGLGTSQDPTPTGHYFVAFFEASPNPGYGPFIIVTSAHSPNIQDWEGSGDAVIGIHGPLGANALIGNGGAYISHGCIRLLIPDLLRLRDVPAGSPINIIN